MVKQVKQKKEKSIEETLLDSPNMLRRIVEPSEYKLVVLGNGSSIKNETR